MRTPCVTRFAITFALLISCGSQPLALAVDPADLQREFQEMREQNQKLREQLERQEKMIQSLNERISHLPSAGEQKEAQSKVSPDSLEAKSGFDEKMNFFGDRIKLSGEAGAGFFHQGSKGAFPNAEFRIDEAKLFLDAKIMDDVYFFTELNLATRESYEEGVEIGEVYIDFENVSRFFDREGLLNLRVGRFDIPFGEEYLARDAIDNPLILHSLADFWGVDEGIEAYGALGPFNYALAVQNGGHPLLHDYTSDKAVTGRLSYEPRKWLHLSASAMRTGDLSVSGDGTSELWFGNGFIRNIATNATRFHGEVFQGDVQVRWERGHLKLYGGYLQSDDNGPKASNRRENYFYSVEALQRLTDKFYGAARFSQIMSGKGTPLVGNGTFDRYFFNNANLTKDIWRLSVGVGYRVNRHLLIKTEYAFEDGDLLGGRSRRIDFFGAEAAVGF